MFNDFMIKITKRTLKVKKHTKRFEKMKNVT